MTDFWPTSAVWMLQTLAAGGVALLIAWMSLKRLASPSSRLSLAKNAMRVGVAAGVLTLLPAWLAVRVPHWMAPTQSTLAAVTLSTPTPAATSEVETPCNTDLEDDLGWHSEFVPVETVAALDLDGCEARVEPIPHHEPAEPRTAACAPDGASDGSLTETAIAQPTVTAPQTLLAAIAPILLIPYWVGVLVVLGRLVVGMIGLARLRQCAKSAPAAVQELVQDLAPDLAKRLPQVLVSDRVPSPICYGILRPTILLPRNLVKTVTTNQLKWVLAHELDHLRRGDPLTGVWVGLANAMFFWLPWFHAVRRELHVAQEHLADSAASTVAGQPVDYAEFLVELSTRPGVPRSVKALPSLAGVRAGQSELSRRIIMILQPQHIRETWWNRTFSALAISGALSSAIVLSGIRLAADDTTPQPAKKIVEVKIAADEKPVEKVKEESNLRKRRRSGTLRHVK